MTGGTGSREPSEDSSNYRGLSKRSPQSAGIAGKMRVQSIEPFAWILHFDPRTGISNIPVVIKGTGIPFSFRTSWSEHYGKTFAVWEVTPQGRIPATWQINPESARALVEDAIA
jgi:hypothetical protein